MTRDVAVLTVMLSELLKRVREVLDTAYPISPSSSDPPDEWFNTSCFAPPLFGNYDIGQVRGPTFINPDFSQFESNDCARCHATARV